MKRVLATALTVATMCVIGGDSKPPIHADEVEFSLISYLETHEIDSYEEFTEIIQTHSVVSTDEIDIDPEKVSYFNYAIDYDSRIVSVITMGEATYDRSQGASNTATKSYYSESGIKQFTISVSGTFSYTSSSCNCISKTGSFTKPIYSLWTSTPSLTSGHINAGKAYAKIYGTATNSVNTRSYSLTLTCDTSGNFTSY